MKTVAALTALIGTAAAFAPAQQSRSSTSLEAKPFADALGAQAPVSTREVEMVHHLGLQDH